MNMLAVLAEVQLFKDWIPMMKESEPLGEVSHLRKLAYLKNNLPWPFTDREIFIQACGIVLKEERACILTLSSAEGDSWFGTPIHRDPKCVTFDMHKAFIYTKAISPNECVLKMIVNADPHLDYIPQKLINFGMKNVIGVFLRYIQSRSEKLEPVYLKLMEEKQDFYDEVAKKVAMVSGPNTAIDDDRRDKKQ